MILALETTSQQGSIWCGTVSKTGYKTAFEASWSRERSHGEHVSVQLDVLNRSIGLSAIREIRVGIGPGSFTGIRVGVNSARTLAYALNIPVFGIRSTDSIAATHVTRNSMVVDQSPLYRVIFPAQMGVYFCSEFRFESSALHTERDIQRDAAAPQTKVEHLVTTEPQVVKRAAVVDQSEGYPVCGYGLSALGIEQTEVFPTAQANATLPTRFCQGDGSWQKIQPLYLRGSGAEENAR